MNDQKQQIVEKLKSANNILVTVSTNPSVDQLAACIGLTLLLNKLEKHATAVFSGEVPSTVEFLKPDETIEKTTDSLRDFIISLDKSKADKLRYKVEDEVVKIFITPYRTSITEKDLVFSQGDFNVDVVVGLGIHRQQDLDAAITAHGRILHDAAVVCINITPVTELGTINWLDLSASSLSELIASLGEELGDNLLDEQNSTALLTGIVAETNHFGNERTTPKTMSLSAKLLEAGANQQLVSDKLSAVLEPPSADLEVVKTDNGVLEIQQPDETGVDNPGQDELLEKLVNDTEKSHRLLAPPSRGGEMSASTKPSDYEPSTDPLSQPSSPMPTLSHDAENAAKLSDPNLPKLPEMPASELPQPVESLEPIVMPEPGVLEQSVEMTTPGIESIIDKPKPIVVEPGTDQTLEELEESVESPHVKDGDVDSARMAVEDALKTKTEDAPLEPIIALNAQPVNLNLSHDEPVPEVVQPTPPIEAPVEPAIPAFTPPPQDPQFPTMPTPTYGLGMPGTTPADQLKPFTPAPSNPNAHEPAPLGMSPADQAFTMPIPSGINIPPPQSSSPTSVDLPPQGPPPPPFPAMPPSAPPPISPDGFGEPGPDSNQQW